MQLARKLHDEDGVLGRQTDDGDHAYFKEDVVGHAAQHHGRDGTEQAQRHHQHHRERDRPAFIECRQNQEDHQRRQQHQQGGLLGRLALLQRLSRPGQCEAWRQLRHQTLHLRHRRSAGDAGRCPSGNTHGREAIEAHHLLR